MVAINKQIDPAKTAQIMREFEKQNMKMDMTDEMSMSIFPSYIYLKFKRVN